MFEFQNPAAFFLLLLIPLLYILRAFKLFCQVTYPAVLADWNGKAFEWKGGLRVFLSALVKVLIILGFCSVIFAFADPVVSVQEKVYTSLGTDVMFVVDTSPSMAARDVDGNTRLEAAVNSIMLLARENEGCRYGAVALGSGSSVLVPPTIDNQVFRQQLGKLKVGLLGNGSAIGDGLSTAVCHLSASSAPKKCIILLTDGENNAGEIHPETAAMLAEKNDISVYVVGIGSKGTVPIEYTDPVSGKLYSGYLDSDYNTASLKKIASIGGGKFFEVKTLEELESTLKFVSKEQSVSQSFTYKTVSNQYYRYLLLAAIILFVAAVFLKKIVLREKTNFQGRKNLIFRTLFLVFAFIMLLLSALGLSWGTYLSPVQKSGTAISFVFDISNSMLAKDGPENSTRLKAASVYAERLLEKMDGIPVSVVLAKGDGVASIPLTEDRAMIESILEVMSPSLMTVAGSSLGKGLLCAKDTFPENYSSAGKIWLFTDGEETDGLLTEAIADCVRQGLSVSIIGFGLETESEILAGDGKTKVRSALRTQKIQEAIEGAQKKLSFYKNKIPVTFVNSTAKGSAYSLINQLSKKDGENSLVSYEAKPVPRYKLFLLLGILAFAFSFICSEFDFNKFFGKQKLSMAGLCIFTLLFTGCSNSTIDMLNGAYSWQKKQYRHSISLFIKTARKAEETENRTALDYSLYNLGTAYAMLGEDAAAMERFTMVSENAAEPVKYAAFYNAGIISFRNGQYEQAEEYFRNALKVDNTNIDAKINLELSMQMGQGKSKQQESKANPASEEKSDLQDMEKTLFEHIKENDKKQWKNSESIQNQNLSEDY